MFKFNYRNKQKERTQVGKIKENLSQKKKDKEEVKRKQIIQALRFERKHPFEIDNQVHVTVRHDPMDSLLYVEDQQVVRTPTADVVMDLNMHSGVPSSESYSESEEGIMDMT